MITDETLDGAASMGADELKEDIGSVAAEPDKQVSEVLAQLQRALQEAQEKQVAMDAVVAEAARSLEQAKAVFAEASTMKDAVLAAQTAVTAKSSQIQEIQLHAEKVRADLDKVLTGATAEATRAGDSKTRAQSAADEAVKLQAVIEATRTSADQASQVAGKAASAAQEHAKQTEKLASKANEVEDTLKTYESELSRLVESSNQELARIDSLLPGATSAGLSYAFNERAKIFEGPRRRWQWIFIGSLLALIALGLTGAWHAIFSSTVLSYDELVRLWLARIPVAAALLWLTLHASRESALAKRLEEDYGYKAAVASSFEGFRKQMSQVSSSGGIDPLAKLCTDTLAAIAQPPGRIYDRHKLTTTPTQELAETFAAVLREVPGRAKGA